MMTSEEKIKALLDDIKDGAISMLVKPRHDRRSHAILCCFSEDAKDSIMRGYYHCNVPLVDDCITYRAKCVLNISGQTCFNEYFFFYEDTIDDQIREIKLAKEKRSARARAAVNEVQKRTLMSD